MDIPETIKDLRAIREGRKYYSWKSFMKKYQCDYVCELGVFRGTNFYQMIKHNPKLAVAVDSWIDDGLLSRNDSGISQENFEELYENFAKNVADKPFVKIYREYTFDAVKHFKDNFFDVVYIDADHSYEGCLRDIEDWYPKVKRGKFLLGDDYRDSDYRVKFGVIEAANEFAQKNNLDLIKLPNFGWAIIKP